MPSSGIDVGRNDPSDLEDVSRGLVEINGLAVERNGMYPPCRSVVGSFQSAAARRCVDTPSLKSGDSPNDENRVGESAKLQDSEMQTFHLGWRWKSTLDYIVIKV